MTITVEGIRVKKEWNLGLDNYMCESCNTGENFICLKNSHKDLLLECMRGIGSKKVKSRNGPQCTDSNGSWPGLKHKFQKRPIKAAKNRTFNCGE